MEDMLLFMLVWGALIVITLGIAMLFFPFVSLKRILDGIVVYDEDGLILGQFRVDLSWAKHLRQIGFWFIVYVVVVALGLITLGMGLLVLPFVIILYNFAAARAVIERTSMVDYGELQKAIET